MSDQQPELDFSRHTLVEDVLAARLLELMSALGDGEWHNARGLSELGFVDRELRVLVEHSAGQIFSYPGSPGYKLLASTTHEEFQRATALLNQGKKMIHRFVEYKRAWNRRAA